MITLVEPFAGLGAVGLHLLAGVRPPASRIGCKAGYAAQIAEHIGAVDRVEWSDADPSLVAGLRAMIGGVDLSPWLGGDPRERWQAAREARHRDPAAWWVHLAGARGGIGGFKGAHVHRPSVDGYIPRREALARRLDEIAALRLGDRVTITCCRADQRPYAAGSVVYLDPPYLDSEPYPDAPRGSAWVPGVWTAAVEAGAASVLLSERAEVYQLPGGTWHRLRRTGQARRSLTTSTDELLHVWRR